MLKRKQVKHLKKQQKITKKSYDFYCFQGKNVDSNLIIKIKINRKKKIKFWK